MKTIRLRKLKALLLLTFVMVLSACGGGEETVTNEQAPAEPEQQPYSGRAAQTADIQAFKLNVWDNLRTDQRCSRCHVAGDQAPYFMRDDNINLAYGEALGLVNRSSPFESRLVTKVGNGHNCWLESNVACADVMLRWIEAWLIVGGETAGRQIQITPLPPEQIRERTPKIQLPETSTEFEDSKLYADVQLWCSDCHSRDAASPRKPYFADTQSAAEAYAAIIPKINLELPEQSRIVERPRDEGHGCEADRCADYASTLEQDVAAFAGTLGSAVFDSTLVASTAVVIADDGIVAAGGNRHETDLIALYEFKTGEGFTALDTSGVDPATNLRLSSEDLWMSNWGLEFDGGDSKAQAFVEDSDKLHDLIRATGEYTVEAWVVPGNVSQEDANIVSYSGSTELRNFTLGQTLYNYDFFNRSTTTDKNGEDALSTADADQDLQAVLQHVVLTYSPISGRRIFVNGVSTDDVDPALAGELSNWSDSFALVLGNEVSGNRPWVGQIRMLAVHNRELTAEQISQNAAIPPGQKYFLIFNTDRFTGLSDSYVLFEVSQFDQYSYLFAEPKFVLLGNDQSLGSVPVRGMRIGINGIIPRTGQVFGNVDTTVTDQNYPEEGYQLSPLGTLVKLGSGIDVDEFFLSFEQLGTNMNAYTDLGSLAPPSSIQELTAPEIGFRLFDEIYATMAELTGVQSISTGNITSDRYPDVRNTYLKVRQQLPATVDADGFLGAHQAGVAQIAIEYCNALVDDSTLRGNFWPDFSFPPANTGTININSWLGDTQRDEIVSPLVNKFLGTNLESQPLIGSVTDTAPKNLADNDGNDTTIKPDMTIKGELNSLIVDLSACGSSCAEGRVETIVKATCSATLGNAGITMQ